MVLTEENGYYSINCEKAIWATDKQHDIYQKSTVSFLKDADWFIERRFVDSSSTKYYEI